MGSDDAVIMVGCNNKRIVAYTNTYDETERGNQEINRQRWRAAPAWREREDGGRCRLGGRERASPAGGEREARWCRCEGGRTVPTREERGDGAGQGERNDDVGMGEEG
jgi:hypothetical protein